VSRGDCPYVSFEENRQMKSAIGSTRGKSKQSATAQAVRPAERKPVRGTRQVEPEVTPDLDMEWLRESSEDRHEVEVLADKVFASVLERCGWQRNERGQIEHVGGDGD
jgi:hypothetical protein